MIYVDPHFIYTNESENSCFYLSKLINIHKIANKK